MINHAIISIIMFTDILYALVREDELWGDERVNKRGRSPNEWRVCVRITWFSKELSHKHFSAHSCLTINSGHAYFSTDWHITNRLYISLNERFVGGTRGL